MGLLFIPAIISCKKFTDIPPPKTEIIISEAFKSDVTATGVVTGIYSQMLSTNSFENSGITIFAGYSADELTPFSPSASTTPFVNNTLLKENGSISSMWSQAFKTLAQINTCIEGLEASTKLSLAVRDQLLGEAKFCRAFEFFYLVNLWGDIPLVTGTDWRFNMQLSRSSTARVYGQMIQDLKDASSLLKTEYPSDEKVRPNKYAAAALLARVYLYQQDWANAEIQAGIVINSGAYTPLPVLDKAFLKSNTEAIWQLMPNSSLQTTEEGYRFLKGGAIETGSSPAFILTQTLLNGIEAGDQRKEKWMKSVNYRGTVYYYPYKYKDPGQSGRTEIKEYYTVLRAGEQYLIRAEAMAHQNNIEGAVKDLNIIRKRARGTTANTLLPDLTITLSQEQCLQAIAQERRIELFCEFGHRWLDLKRSNQANAVLGALKPSWTSNALLFPIPKGEIEKNTNLSQNGNY